MSIFVFGSNLAGRHGKGAALCARKEYGAIYGQGEGRQGESYAIPTKGYHLETLPLSHIGESVGRFLIYAASQPATSFTVTRIGCGLARYTDTDIAPMFRNAPPNCILPPGWRT